MASSDLGNIANGAYRMNLHWFAGTTPVFRMYRDGTLRATVNDDGWRNWSLTNADFQLFSETLNRGDQNGGSPTDKLFMTQAQWGVNSGGLASISFPFPCVAGANAPVPAEYGCSDLSVLVSRDSVITWTNNR